MGGGDEGTNFRAAEYIFLMWNPYFSVESKLGELTYTFGGLKNRRVSLALFLFSSCTNCRTGALFESLLMSFKMLEINFSSPSGDCRIQQNSTLSYWFSRLLQGELLMELLVVGMEVFYLNYF